MSDDPKDAAQAHLDSLGIRPGAIYRHYKGGLYTVVCASLKEDTLEPMITYRSNEKGACWTRTADNFLDLVFTQDGQKGDVVPAEPRFQRVRE